MSDAARSEGSAAAAWVDGLEGERLEVLCDLAVADTVDRELWRRVWGAEPERLKAFERLLEELAPHLDGDPPRLRAGLRRALERRLAAERARELAARAAAVSRSVFRAELLGHPRWHRRDPGGGPEVEISWSLRRAFEVVAFLALTPGLRATKDEIVEAVWPEASGETVRKNFHPTLTAARRALEVQAPGGIETLVYGQGLYRLSPRAEWRVDAVELERLAAAGEELLETGDEAAADRVLELWLAAWRSYRGPLLAGSDAAWVSARREEVYLRYLRLLRQIGELAARRDRLTEALDAYRTVLLEDPFEERVHVAVMEVYARQGRRDLVRRQYVRLQDTLEELNVEPTLETQERYHQLMKR